MSTLWAICSLLLSHPPVLLVYLLLAALIGHWGRQRWIGALPAFTAALLLTPLFGFLIVRLSRPLQSKRRDLMPGERRPLFPQSAPQQENTRRTSVMLAEE